MMTIFYKSTEVIDGGYKYYARVGDAQFYLGKQLHVIRAREAPATFEVQQLDAIGVTLRSIASWKLPVPIFEGWKEFAEKVLDDTDCECSRGAQL